MDNIDRAQEGIFHKHGKDVELEVSTLVEDDSAQPSSDEQDKGGADGILVVGNLLEAVGGLGKHLVGKVVGNPWDVDNWD